MDGRGARIVYLVQGAAPGSSQRVYLTNDPHVEHVVVAPQLDYRPGGPDWITLTENPRDPPVCVDNPEDLPPRWRSKLGLYDDRHPRRVRFVRPTDDVLPGTERVRVVRQRGDDYDRAEPVRIVERGADDYYQAHPVRLSESESAATDEWVTPVRIVAGAVPEELLDAPAGRSGSWLGPPGPAVEWPAPFAVQPDRPTVVTDPTWWELLLAAAILGVVIVGGYRLWVALVGP